MRIKYSGHHVPLVSRGSGNALDAALRRFTQQQLRINAGSIDRAGGGSLDFDNEVLCGLGECLDADGIIKFANAIGADPDELTKAIADAQANEDAPPGVNPGNVEATSRTNRSGRGLVGEELEEVRAGLGVRKAPASFRAVANANAKREFPCMTPSEIRAAAAARGGK